MKPFLSFSRNSLTFSKNVFVAYHIYWSEHPGCSFNFDLSKGGTYLRKALIKYIKKVSKYFQLVSLIKQYK